MRHDLPDRDWWGSGKTMRDAEPTIRSPLVSRLLTMIAPHSLRETLRIRHGIPDHKLHSPYEAVALSRYVALFEEIAQLKAEPFLGARIGAEQNPAEALGPLGFLFLTAPSLRAALLTISHHLSTWQTGSFIDLRTSDDSGLWSYRIDCADIWPRRQDAEYTLASTCAMIRARQGEAWRPQAVHFEHDEPSQSNVLRGIFRAPLLFRQPYNALGIDKALLDRPFRSPFDCFIPYMERHMQEMRMVEPEPSGIAARVRDLVRHALGHRDITLDWVAQELAMPARTLQRHLASEGTSLRALIQEVRRAEAEGLLSSGMQTPADVAQALGYADNTAFWRAFKSWAGTSPRGYARGRSRGRGQG